MGIVLHGHSRARVLEIMIQMYSDSTTGPHLAFSHFRNANLGKLPCACATDTEALLNNTRAKSQFSTALTLGCSVAYFFAFVVSGVLLESHLAPKV